MDDTWSSLNLSQQNLKVGKSIYAPPLDRAIRQKDTCNNRGLAPRRISALSQSFPRSAGVHAGSAMLGGDLRSPSPAITFVPVPSSRETAERQKPLSPRGPAAAVLLRDRQRSSSGDALMAAPSGARHPRSSAPLRPRCRPHVTLPQLRPRPSHTRGWSLC